MSHRASSSHGDPSRVRWFREPWPWFLMAGPFIVVVASLASAWIAAASDDGVVAEDYYKQGLLINRRLATMDREHVREPTATISFARDGTVRVHLEGSAPTSRLWLSLARPGERTAREVSLTQKSDGDWIGIDGRAESGRLIVKLESDHWQLPVTTIAGRPAEIHLGAMRPQSGLAGART